jgi:hypothetical protein
MTFVGTDLIWIIEEVLPSRFGGSSLDYQMLEEEDEKGLTHMSIVVDPEIGPVNEEALVRTVLAELAKGKDGQRMMASVWARSKTLRVRRAKPYVTSMGKLLPLHTDKFR